MDGKLACFGNEAFVWGMEVGRSGRKRDSQGGFGLEWGCGRY